MNLEKKTDDSVYSVSESEESRGLHLALIEELKRKIDGQNKTLQDQDKEIKVN